MFRQICEPILKILSDVLSRRKITSVSKSETNLYYAIQQPF